MTNAASAQGLEVFKERLREFLETSDTGRQAMAMSGSKPSEREKYRMDTLDSDGKKTTSTGADEDEDI
ncbi:unnamed protein product [Aureobasidium pullulans]|nr:unnamed protein product [Aureobasidium pullulans]